jgi:hypothetical protein
MRMVARSEPMHKNTAWPSACSTVVGLGKGAEKFLITARRPAAMCCILFAPMAGCAAPELADLCAYGRRVMPN